MYYFPILHTNPLSQLHRSIHYFIKSHLQYQLLCETSSQDQLNYAVHVHPTGLQSLEGSSQVQFSFVSTGPHREMSILSIYNLVE